MLSAGHIMERVWGYNSDSGVATVKTHMRRLREKIQTLPGSPRPIRTLPGVGYMLMPSERGDDKDEADEPLRALA